MKVKRPKCSLCSKEAVVTLPYARLRLCEEHFEEFMKKRVKRIELPKRVVAGLSGGKDSVAMTYLLKEIGVDVVAVTVNTVPEYTEREAEGAEKLAEELDIQHVIVYPEELYGFSALHYKYLRRKPCSLCSALRRHALDLVAKRLGINYVATGHNADDMASLALTSLLKQDMDALRKVSPIEEPYGPFVGKVKPLFWVPERDVLAFVLAKGLHWIKASCPLYEQGSTFTDKVKEFLNEMEDRWPGTKINLLKSILKLVPQKGVKEGVKACKYCGLPSWGEVCSVCKLRDKYKGRLPKVRPLKPTYACEGDGNTFIIGIGWCKVLNVEEEWTRVDKLLKKLGLNKEVAVAYDGKPLPHDAWIGSWDRLLIFVVPRLSPV